MKILFLYSEIGPYNIPVFQCLVRNHGAEVHVVCWDKHRLTPYVPPPIQGVMWYRRSELSSKRSFRTPQRPGQRVSA